jgi:6-pyruvoyltetrahydropterin/6-carboxytetrahydropterin synthase
MSGAEKAYFGRRYLLSASHRLHAVALTDEENRAVYGKCNNPHGHGHNYMVEVAARGAVDAETGMEINLVAMDEAVERQVIGRFDHQNLNLDPLFASRVPTTENLSRAIYTLLDGTLAPAELAWVRVEETENNFFECRGEEHGG